MPDHPQAVDDAASRTREGPRARHGVRNAVVVLALLAAAGGAYAVYGGQGAAPAPPAAMPPAAVTVSPPLQRMLARTSEFTGQFSAVDQVELRAQVSGYLTEIHVADGQLVRRGDLLFVIDSRPYEIALQSAAAQVQAAAATLELAGKQVARSTVLKRSDFESAEVVDQRTQVVQAAAATLEQARAAVRSAQLNLGFTRITAPFDGRLGARQVSLGSLVSGGAGTGTTLSTIVSLDPIHLDFDMDEADALLYQRYVATTQPAPDRPAPDRPAPNRTVDISLGDDAGWTRHGTLDFLDNQVDRGSGTLHARATVANPGLLVTPGQFARVQVPMSAPRPVLLVPDSALVTDQSRKVVMTASADGAVIPKPVEIGPLDGDTLRVVTAGLAPDDQVIINGLMRLRPGARVAPHPGKIDEGTANGAATDRTAR